jgi:hypothetical protein
VDRDLDAIAAELLGERFGPRRLAKVPTAADVIAERRRILLDKPRPTSRLHPVDNSHPQVVDRPGSAA